MKNTKKAKSKINRCYLCKETEEQVKNLFLEGNRFVCDNCLTNR